MLCPTLQPLCNTFQNFQNVGHLENPKLTVQFDSYSESKFKKDFAKLSLATPYNSHNHYANSPFEKATTISNWSLTYQKNGRFKNLVVMKWLSVQFSNIHLK